MNLAVSNASVIRSIKQRELLNEWIRLYAAHNCPPRFDDYRPNRLAEEMPDIMICDVTEDAGQPRFVIETDCERMHPAFGPAGKGRDLDEYLGPAHASLSIPLYMQCTGKRLPVYTISRINDAEERVVDYERLLMPFFDDGRVTRIMVSLKAISEDGRFEIVNLMRRDAVPVPVHASLIGHDLAPQRQTRPAADEIEFR